MRIGTKDKWKFVDDPCDTGNPLISKTVNGQRKHFNPGDSPITVALKHLEHGTELTESQIRAIFEI